MSWQIGDLAVCVDARANPVYGCDMSLVEGQTYRVSEVIGGNAPGNAMWPGGGIGLEVEGVRSRSMWGFAALRFRKVEPPQHEACEPEFVTLLKRKQVSA